MIRVATGPWVAAPIRLPPGASEAVVGDMHGMAGHLAALLHHFDQIAPDAHLTFLGDLISRGPDSPGALRLATRAVLSRPGRATLLPGNHEAMMLAATYGMPFATGTFRRFGGNWLLNATRVGEGLDGALRRLLGGDGFEVLTQGGLLLGPPDRRIRARMHRRAGDLLLVHVGVDPVAPDAGAWIAGRDPLHLDMAEEAHPLWIRGPFLAEKGPYPGGLFVGHGHVPEHRTARQDGTRAQPGQHRHDGWRLGLNGDGTAAGVVAATVFEDARYRVVTASGR